MSTVVEVPGEGDVEFPDGMSDKDIGKAIKLHLTKKAMIPPSGTLPGQVQPPVSAALQGQSNKQIYEETAPQLAEQDAENKRTHGINPKYYDGFKAMLSPDSSLDERAGGLSQVAREAGKAVLPIVAPVALASAPISTLLSAGSGVLAGQAGSAVAEHLGAGEGVSNLAGDVAGGAAAAATGPTLGFAKAKLGGIADLAAKLYKTPLGKAAASFIPGLSTAMKISDSISALAKNLERTDISAEALHALSYFSKDPANITPHVSDSGAALADLDSKLASQKAPVVAPKPIDPVTTAERVPGMRASDLPVEPTPEPQPSPLDKWHAMEAAQKAGKAPVKAAKVDPLQGAEYRQGMQASDLPQDEPPVGTESTPDPIVAKKADTKAKVLAAKASKNGKATPAPVAVNKPGGAEFYPKDTKGIPTPKDLGFGVYADMVPDDSSTLAHIQAQNEKAYNVADYAFNSGIRDPKVFDMLDEEQRKDLVHEALAHGNKVGNPIPASTEFEDNGAAKKGTGYKTGLSGHSLRLAKAHLEKMAQDEINNQ